MNDDVKKLGEPTELATLVGANCKPVQVEVRVAVGDLEYFDPRTEFESPVFNFGKSELNINLEAWEPCVECKTCRNCKNYDDYDQYEGTTGECGQCYKMSNFEPVNFCHDCGKPLTEEARTMLEKRLMGCAE